MKLGLLWDAMTTIYDVARRAKVSTAAVSLTMNDTGTTRVSAAKKKLIMEAAREIGYRPNGIAKALSEGSTHILGLVVPMRDPIFFNHFIVEVLAGIQSCLMERNYHLMIYTHGSSAGGITQGEMIQSRYADGVIVLNTRLCSEQDMLDTIENLQGASIPFVMVNGRPAGVANLAYVGVEEYEVGRLAGEFLIGEGHRRIAVLGGAQRSPGGEVVLHGVQDACREKKLPVKYPLHEYSEFERGRIGRIVTEWMAARQPPTAIFCDDQMASEVYAALNTLGLRVPADVAVLGRGDLALAATLIPKLTTIRVPAMEIGRLAAEMLIDQVERMGQPDPIAAELKQLLLPSSVTMRESV
jgi:LacI family transcriptional regulator